MRARLRNLLDAALARLAHCAAADHAAYGARQGALLARVAGERRARR